MAEQEGNKLYAKRVFGSLFLSKIFLFARAEENLFAGKKAANIKFIRP